MGDDDAKPPRGARPAKPTPAPSPESTPFWRAAKRRQLMIQRCNSCGRFWFPPSLRCARCLSDDVEWRETEGAGRIHSFVTFHRVYHPAFADETPYVVAVVELAEGPRLLTNIVGAEPERLRCGMEVRVVFDDVSPDFAIPKFTPGPGAADA